MTIAGKSGVAEFACDPREEILRAGLAAGYDLPYECASGTCGSCKATLVSGETDYLWSDAPGRKYCKTERNEILMCQSHALTDCALTIPRAIAELPEGAAPVRREGSIRNYRHLAPDVCAFEVGLDRPMRFQAGQFVLLEHGDVTGARSYSMTNYEPEVSELHFLVKRFANGRFTDFLFAGNPEGERVSVFGPLGRATFEPELARPIVCIAGGSGIAGFRSILTRAHEAKYFHAFDGRVFFGVRTVRDAFWLEELAEFVAASNGGLEVTIALSHEEPADDLPVRFPHLKFTHGFVHEVAGRAMEGRFAGRMAFVAGPPPMVDAALRLLLLEARLKGTDIRYDKFS